MCRVIFLNLLKSYYKLNILKKYEQFIIDNTRYG